MTEMIEPRPVAIDLERLARDLAGAGPVPAGISSWWAK
jgi:hypothetical protein